jgi:hypothetical protein
VEAVDAAVVLERAEPHRRRHCHSMVLPAPAGERSLSCGRLPMAGAGRVGGARENQTDLQTGLLVRRAAVVGARIGGRDRGFDLAVHVWIPCAEQAHGVERDEQDITMVPSGSGRGVGHQRHVGALYSGPAGASARHVTAATAAWPSRRWEAASWTGTQYLRHPRLRDRSRSAALAIQATQNTVRGRASGRLRPAV